VRTRIASAFTAAVVVAALTAGCASGEAAAGGPASGGPAGDGAPPASAATAAAPLPPITRPAGDVALRSPVGPGPDFPILGLDRDAGVSARLSDGSMVWFFGDTGDLTPTGQLRFFEVGSASWAPAETPTTTFDVVVGDKLLPFAPEGGDAAPCPVEAPTAGKWPLAAVVDPQGGRDRVVVWMANVCLGADRTLRGGSIAVGEWWYDPSRPPVDRPVRVELLNERLFPDGRLGGAAVLEGDTVHVYGCDVVQSPASPADNGPCRVARVDVDEVDDPRAYRMWNGQGWGGRAADLPMAPSPSDASLPPGPFSVARFGPDGPLAMTYTSWPGYHDTAIIRMAERPEGPWGPPLEVPLPGCVASGPSTRTACYAANRQPAFDEPGRLGIGWYDQHVHDLPRRGSFVVGTVPLEVGTPGG
jgi:hypothetical protein